MRSRDIKSNLKPPVARSALFQQAHVSAFTHRVPSNFDACTILHNFLFLHFHFFVWRGNSPHIWFFVRFCLLFIFWNAWLGCRKLRYFTREGLNQHSMLRFAPCLECRLTSCHARWGLWFLHSPSNWTWGFFRACLRAYVSVPKRGSMCVRVCVCALAQPTQWAVCMRERALWSFLLIMTYWFTFLTHVHGADTQAFHMQIHQ